MMGVGWRSSEPSRIDADPDKGIGRWCHVFGISCFGVAVLYDVCCVVYLDNLGRFLVQRISFSVQQGEASEAMAWLYIGLHGSACPGARDTGLLVVRVWRYAIVSAVSITTNSRVSEHCNADHVQHMRFQVMS
jgi:hypothetical protein